ncbi:endonuclease/exonuclease/phosphatase family protein [Kiloniella sp. b19]|uniref:endonuclease/exonuclease/phosphatase family protein n=1 Tax=Kiloniella sp. GXU_MW_B19 TaxID=3141326 RepID=UPI0031D7EF5C
MSDLSPMKSRQDDAFFSYSGAISSESCEELPVLAQEERIAIRELEKTSAVHRRAMADTPAMSRIERGGRQGRQETLSGTGFRVAAWNLERCLDPAGSAAKLRSIGADIVLLSEMDCGMARTGQRHPTREIAFDLGMTYAYGVEFLELGLGAETELAFCEDDFNSCGWHGNAILSKVPLQRVQMLRLDEHGHWFSGLSVNGEDPSQARVGGRMALFATVETDRGEVVVVSTHLESNGGIAHRNHQISMLINHLEHYAEGRPVLIGGDLNTGNHLPDFDWKLEMLFQTAEERGYDWSTNMRGATTRPSRITLTQDVPKKLDWFASKGLQGRNPEIVAALDAQNQPLSDHEMITAVFEVPDSLFG